MEERGEVLYELSPKFDFIYELNMPSGRKMKKAFLSFLTIFILRIILIFLKKTVENVGTEVALQSYSILSIALTIFAIILFLIFIFRIVVQVSEYKGIKYKFYRDCLVVENNFLSQSKKTIEYTNIKEIEIRRSVMDRILNYGIIILYTNADKSAGSATVIYAIKNTQEIYNNIESLVHNGNVVTTPIKETGNTHNVEVELQNAMNRNETYSETTADSDINPLDKNN